MACRFIAAAMAQKILILVFLTFLVGCERQRPLRAEVLTGRPTYIPERPIPLQSLPREQAGLVEGAEVSGEMAGQAADEFIYGPIELLPSPSPHPDSSVDLPGMVPDSETGSSSGTSIGNGGANPYGTKGRPIR